MTTQRWVYAEFGYGGSGENDLREVWFSHRETWMNRPVDPSLTLRDLGDLGFELVNLLRYPRAFDAQLFYRQSRFTMRMTATSSFYIFKRPLADPALAAGQGTARGGAEDENPPLRAVDRPSDY
jgi:hypothetical protein